MPYRQPVSQTVSRSARQSDLTSLRSSWVRLGARSAISSHSATPPMLSPTARAHKDLKRTTCGRAVFAAEGSGADYDKQGEQAKHQGSGLRVQCLWCTPCPCYDGLGHDGQIPQSSQTCTPLSRAYLRRHSQRPMSDICDVGQLQTSESCELTQGRELGHTCMPCVCVIQLMVTSESILYPLLGW